MHHAGFIASFYVHMPYELVCKVQLKNCLADAVTSLLTLIGSYSLTCYIVIACNDDFTLFTPAQIPHHIKIARNSLSNSVIIEMTDKMLFLDSICSS